MAVERLCGFRSHFARAVITRLTGQWQTDYDAWQKRDLSARRYVYVWADGVCLQARMEELIGATPEGSTTAAASSTSGPEYERRLVWFLSHTRTFWNTGLSKRASSLL